MNDSRLSYGMQTTTQDYFPGGSLMPGRYSDPDKFRYGFNGKEKLDELYDSEGSAYDFGARMYDSRLGRWMKCDPMAVKYPGYSPYHFGYCDPIAVIDPDGRENVIVVGVEGEGSFERTCTFLRKAVYYGKKLKAQGEETTVLIHEDALTNTDEAKKYRKMLSDAGIKIVTYGNKQDVINYINDRKKIEGLNVSEEKVTDLVFILHGWHGYLNLIFDNSSQDEVDNRIYPSDIANINEDAFSENAVINLGACFGGEYGTREARGIAAAFAVKLNRITIGPQATTDYSGDISPYIHFEGSNVYLPGSSTPDPTLSIKGNSSYFRMSMDKVNKEIKKPTVYKSATPAKKNASAGGSLEKNRLPQIRKNG